jgi:hypothetical protein
MVKKIQVNKPKRQKFDPFVQILALKYAKTDRFIRMIRDGERNQARVFSDYMFMQTGWNKLVEEVNKLVPFDEEKK